MLRGEGWEWGKFRVRTYVITVVSTSQPARRSLLGSTAAMKAHRKAQGAMGDATAKRRRRARTNLRGACASTPGPRDIIEALTDWADVQRWQAATASPLSDRLANKVRVGLDLTSHYSGTGAAESALAAIAGDQFVSYSACDIDLICQDVLVHHPEGVSAPQHVFADLFDRPPCGNHAGVAPEVEAGADQGRRRARPCFDARPAGHRRRCFDARDDPACGSGVGSRGYVDFGRMVADTR